MATRMPQRKLALAAKVAAPASAPRRTAKTASDATMT